MDRRVRAWLLLGISVLLVTTCRESPTGLRGNVRLVLAPRFTKSAEAAAQQLAAFSLGIDNVRITVIRPPTEILLDTTVTVPAGADSILIDLTVPGSSVGEQLHAGLQLRQGQQVLFVGELTVIAQGPGSAQTSDVPTAFVGPGSSAVALAIAPRDTTIKGSDSVVFRHVATDALQQTVPDAQVLWSSSDTTLATIDDSGLLHASGRHGTVQVTGRTLGGLRDSTNVNLVGTATQLAVTTAPPSNVNDRTVFPTQPVVQLEDVAGVGTPIAGVGVTASLSAAGTIPPGSVSGTVTTTLNGTTTVTTNASGVATFTNLKIIGQAGAYTLMFSAQGVTSASVPLTLLGGTPTDIYAFAGDNQSAAAGTDVPTPPAALVTDVDGNGVGGVAVTFAVASGGGSITGASQTTNSSGIATVGSWTLGTTPGSNTLTATSTGLTNSPLTFAASGTTGNPTTIALVAGNNQTATVGANVTTAPQVKVTDNVGNPVAGVAVTFAVASGGGSITGGNQVTDVNGVAAVGGWQLGTTAGTNTLTATSNGLTGSPVTFTATGTAGAATTIAVNAGNGQTATVATSVATKPSVLVTDNFGNPKSGVAVTFAVASGGGSITGANATTGANGIATVGSWTLGPTAGANSLTATSTGLTGSPLTFTATGTAGVATTIAINAGNGQSAVAGAAVATKPSVKVSDAHGNGVSGVAVAFAVASGGGSITGANQTTNASGIATVGSWTLGSTPGSNSLTATSTGLTGSPLTFTATGSTSGTQFVYNFCPQDNILWFAYQNFGGAWTPVTVSNNSASFTVTTEKFAFAWVGQSTTQSGTSYNTEVIYSSLTELQSVNGTQYSCSSTPGTKTLNGSVAGIVDPQQAAIDMGGSDAAASQAAQTFTLTNVRDGSLDLLAARTMTTGTLDFITTSDELIIRRGLNLPDQSTITPVLDFGTAEPVATVSNTEGISGLQAGDVPHVFNYLYTNTSSLTTFDAFLNSGASSVNVTAAPSSALVTGDLQDLYAFVSGTNEEHVIDQYYVNPVNQTLALGPALSVPTITNVATTPYWRERVQFASQQEYSGTVWVLFADTSNTHGISMLMTPGYTGGVPATWDVTIPDFSAVSGFNTTWMLTTGQNTTWLIFGYGTNAFTPTPPADGVKFTFAIRSSPSVIGPPIRAGVSAENALRLHRALRALGRPGSRGFSRASLR